MRTDGDAKRRTVDKKRKEEQEKLEDENSFVSDKEK